MDAMKIMRQVSICGIVKYISQSESSRYAPTMKAAMRRLSLIGDFGVFGLPVTSNARPVSIVRRKDIQNSLQTIKRLPACSKPVPIAMAFIGVVAFQLTLAVIVLSVGLPP